MSNCMLCTVLHCLPLPLPHRARLLRLLFSQSTPLPPAQPLTRWRGHLQQVVVVPTQDLLLNLWPTRLNLTLRTHRAVPIDSSHRMGRWIKHYYLWNHNMTDLVLIVFLMFHYICFTLKRKKPLQGFWICTIFRIYFNHCCSKLPKLDFKNLCSKYKDNKSMLTHCWDQLKLLYCLLVV